MESIDELLKGRSSSKRKLEPLRDPNEVYKSARHTSKTSPHTSAAATNVHNPAEDDDTEAGPVPPPEDDDGDYGPAAPPDEDQGGEDDEEGRFFGSGISAQERRILDFVPDDTTDGPEQEIVIDASWLRKTALKFEQRINKNAAQRAKYESEPAKFIASEAELDADIRALSIVGEHPELYPLLVELGTVGSLVGLLAHENSDIAIAAIEIIGEWTDEDVQAEDKDWDGLVDALLASDLVDLLTSNLKRLDEDGEDDADRSGVYNILAILENLCSRPATAVTIGKNKELLRWLLDRIQKPEKGGVSQNKQYAAEIIAILMQDGAEINRRRLAERNAVDIVLQLVAPYRKGDPEKDSTEEGYVETLFEALTSIVDDAEGKTKLIEAEGIELCLIMLKEGKMSKIAALRLLLHAAAGLQGADVCLKLIDAGGLKALFSLFASLQKSKHKQARHKTEDVTAVENLLDIFSWMLRSVPPETPERIRLLAKFVEKDYEKLAMIATVRTRYTNRLEQVAKETDPDDDEDTTYLRRLDAGLFVLRSIDAVLLWICAEDGGAKQKLIHLLGKQDEKLDEIQPVVTEWRDGLDTSTAEGKDTQEMLTSLLEAVFPA